ncbi:translation initiation factor IF-1 [Populus alba x Populus x berolinensis]|uniref:Translation initiation factor IF-1, chloroplastic n=3 Tax=Populus TaxID=3689 RepID=A0A4U5QK86_POPAL|nr:translation initiation factor IF-1, chloroplastic-like [Populus alba]KAG6770630.1 hypothetical protein POTOM_026318 [Populus tomentosa]KAJ6924595.1 translation initiation factor IF-1 [Populus alba x Populus x berolinensis]KAJ6994898.1 translation initiation factor IF-1 [Populus alba x Populus x berolinensis]TKS09567.1 hypothetical protein D5086_0000092170 [Populus alba]
MTSTASATATQIHVLTATGFSTKPTNLSPTTVFFGQSLTRTTHSFGLVATTTSTTSSRFPVSTSAKANPTGEQKWTHEGSVTESLPNGMFRVLLDNKDLIIGYISGKIRKNFVRILPGDRVKVEVSRYDSSRGRIVYRLRNRDPTSE